MGEKLELELDLKNILKEGFYWRSGRKTNLDPQTLEEQETGRLKGPNVELMCCFGERFSQEPD